ncbi:HAMP domain-containing sensor histidine kinase [Marivita sp.]|uniref:sensor histidine kinase n=1 Tax=Marivita sp. TaxID=2003365 RepID=UPI0025BA7F2A|nr:HAMP domain-containing sensor histidine kinase [Marivita sp.]
MRSSTLQLTLLLSVIFALGMVLAIFASLAFGRDALLRRVDDQLLSLAATVEVDEASGDEFSLIIRPLDELGNLPQAFARAARGGGGTVSLDDDFRRSDDWRVLVASDSENTPILIAVPLDDSEDALDLLGGVLWSTAGVVLVFVLLIGLGAGLLAQRRFQRIKVTLDDLAAGDLQARTGVSRSSDDLGDVALQLDATASELERLVVQTRNLSASLAHDLRTPLARLQARLEALPNGEERSAALEEASRLSGIFDTIMRVARIEAGQGREGFETLNLGKLAREVAEIFGPVVEDNAKTIILDVANPATLQADRKMLIQAMANLIQNAIVHGGSQITLFANGTSIGVSDDGEGVDPSHFEDMIKPMVRLDAARNSDGSGLGLALVRAVADRHNARLQLAQEKPHGLRVTINFTEL